MTTAAVRPLVVDDWNYVPRPGAGRQLVCFPHAGGDVTAFAMLAEAVAPGLEVWAVRLPGRGGRFAEPMPTGFRYLVDAVTAGIAPNLHADAIFYGQSFGALLAYEVARALPPHQRPSLLIPAGAPAPADWAGAVPDPETGAAELFAQCVPSSALPADGPLREFALGTLRADLTVCRDHRHTPSPLPAFAIHAVAGADDPMVTPTALAAWSSATTGPFTTSTVPGGHLLATASTPGPAALLTTLGGT